MLLPYLRVGGMQLFRAESSDQSDKIRARVSEMTWEIFSIYAVLTVLCAIVLTVVGMPLFDAVCHAMSIIATGGFANKDASIGFYQSAPIEWVTTLFTLIGGMAFALMARAVWHGDWRGTRPRYPDALVFRLHRPLRRPGDAVAGRGQRPCVRAGVTLLRVYSHQPRHHRRLRVGGLLAMGSVPGSLVHRAAVRRWLHRLDHRRHQGVPLLHPRLVRQVAAALPGASAPRAAADL